MKINVIPAGGRYGSMVCATKRKRRDKGEILTVSLRVLTLIVGSVGRWKPVIKERDGAAVPVVGAAVPGGGTMGRDGEMIVLTTKKR